jgi:hypothetical protein
MVLHHELAIRLARIGLVAAQRQPQRAEVLGQAGVVAGGIVAHRLRPVACAPPPSLQRRHCRLLHMRRKLRADGGGG